MANNKSDTDSEKFESFQSISNQTQWDAQDTNIQSGFKIDVKRPASLERLIGGLNGENDELSRITGKQIFVIPIEDLAPIFQDLILNSNSDNISAEKPSYIVFKEEHPDFIEHAMEGTHGVDSATTLISQLCRKVVLSQSPALGMPISDLAGAVFWHNQGVSNTFRIFSECIDWGNSSPPKFAGTIEELHALVLLHELEHAATNQREDLHNHMGSDDLKQHQQNMMEVESDIAAFVNATGIISDKAVSSFVDMRFAFAAYAHCNDLLHDSDSRLQAPEHDTALFVREYESTGFLPDYDELAVTRDSFYSKISETIKEYIMQSQGRLSTDDSIPIGVIMDVVRENLVSQTSLKFEGMEVVAAQYFLDAMNRLSINPEPISDFTNELKVRSDRERDYLQQDSANINIDSLIPGKN